MRKEVGRQWGSDLAYPHREAVIYHNLETEIYEVEYYDKGKLIETREMVTESEDGNRTVHSLRYAEDAAENYCLGYMQVGDGKEKIPEEKTFEIKVTEFDEREDGSAIVTLEMDVEAKCMLVEAGFISLIRKHIDEIENG